MPESDLIIELDVDDATNRNKDNGSTPIDSSPSSTSNCQSKNKRTRLTFPFGACRVCSDSATGIHYGIATCEGCKGFFKRSILRKEKYRCYFDNSCLINVTNRNRCKACRFRRCIGEGMSVDGVKMGRIPKLVKEKALREQQEQQLKEKTMLAETSDQYPETRPRESSSCSSLSDRSIENCDPNAMEIEHISAQVSPIRRRRELAKMYSDENWQRKDFSNDHCQSYFPASNPATCIIDQVALSINVSQSSDESNFSESKFDTAPMNHRMENGLSRSTVPVQRQDIIPIVHKTRYPTYLPDDFTPDETFDMTEYSSGPLSDEIFKHVETISRKLNNNNSSLAVDLNENELTFIRFLRWSMYDLYLRHSKRVKQLVVRMNNMIEHGIDEYPGENATLKQFTSSLQSMIKVFIHGIVVYVQETPGMTNMGSSNLHTMMVNRPCDYYLIKYAELYNDNGQTYVVFPDGLQNTREWIEKMHGKEFASGVFEFTRCIRALNLSDSEYALIMPLQLCIHDPTMVDQDTPRMLRSCYLYALYTELCANRGEQEGKMMCRKVLQVLDLLIPISALYKEQCSSIVLELN